jgi:peptide/nickel transport system permease protein
MFQYIGRKLAVLPLILLGITLLVFLMRALVPGDPVDMMLFGQYATPESKAELRAHLGLDKSLPIQYGIFMTNLLKGDLGTSARTRDSVAKEIVIRYPNTIKLALASLAIAVMLGIPTGVIAAVKKDTIIDVGAMLLVSIGVSMPAFWLAFIFMYFFGVRLEWLPVMGADGWLNLIMPASTLGLIYASIIGRLTRSGMLEILFHDYVRTARAKGLPESLVVYRHALRNAMIPVVTIIGLQFGYLLGGAFIVETVFVYTGLGELAVRSIGFRDFPMVQGITLCIAMTTVLINLTIDLLYGLLNPQIRYG